MSRFPRGRDWGDAIAVREICEVQELKGRSELRETSVTLASPDAQQRYFLVDKSRVADEDLCPNRVRIATAVQDGDA